MFFSPQDSTIFSVLSNTNDLGVRPVKTPGPACYSRLLKCSFFMYFSHAIFRDPHLTWSETERQEERSSSCLV